MQVLLAELWWVSGARRSLERWTYAAEEVTDVDGQDPRMSWVIDDRLVANILAVRVFDTQRATLLQALIGGEFGLVVLSRMAIRGFRFGQVAM